MNIKNKRRGASLINSLINNLPVQLHAPSYKFLGPGTRNLNENPINKLDALAREHDLFYNSHPNLKDRHRADKRLEEEAWKIFKSENADKSHNERFWSWLTTTLMKTKRKLGMGMRAKFFSTRRRKRRTNRKKVGGMIPLLPIMAALATAGTVGNSISGITNAVGAVKNLFTKKSGSGIRKRRRRQRRRTGNGIYLNPPDFYSRKR